MSAMPHVFASVVVRRGEDILVVQQAKADVRGCWIIPGGHVERGERPIDAARRECLEETGLAVEIRDVVGIYCGPTWVLFAFGADAERDAVARAGDEIMDVAWRSPTDLIALPDEAFDLPSMMRALLQDVVAGVSWSLDVVPGVA